MIALHQALVDVLAPDGIGVSVLCSGSIRSNIHQLRRNRVEGCQPSVAFAAATGRLGQRQVQTMWMVPETVGDMVDAI